MRNRFRCAAADHLAAAVPTLRTEVNQVIGGLDDIEIVLDDHDRVALFDQLLKYVHQLVHVRNMQSGCRLVENIDGLAG